MRTAFTLVSLMGCLGLLATLAFYGAIGYVIVHFIAKFW